MALVTLDRVSLAFGHLPLLDAVSGSLEAGERVCVLGRNGAGKSTLLQLLAGEIAPDGGTIWRQPGLRVAHLVQDVPLTSTATVFAAVAEGLGELAALTTAYHEAAGAVEAAPTPVALARLGDLQHALEERDGWRLEQRVEHVVSRLDLPADARVDTLSGGWRRRVLLGRALVAQPDLLLLDEPTNHLDLEAITWLEDALAEYPGTVVFVTHDRSFLQRLATRVLELDRGRLLSWPGDYPTYLERKEAALAAETAQQAKFDKRLAAEEAWLRQGIKARRTRDEGRVRALLALRAERAARRELAGRTSMRATQAPAPGKLVVEAHQIAFAFGDGPPIVDDFSIRMLRGDRIGLIGPNGAGKTTLLRLLTGDLPPTHGAVRHGANLAIAYFDQQREQLDPDRSVFDTIGEGNETVTVNGQSRHVHGYLRDYLFPPERAQSPVRALSGGERNRLLLARLFTRPANVLVLDEPTNDLDLETLELLEAQLVAWPGTLLLVSHDRTFLDNVVTSTLVFEGQGRVQEYVGGYTDWLRQREAAAALRPAAAAPSASMRPAAVTAETSAGTPAKRRLSYHEQRELASLPARLEALEAELAALRALTAGPEFYKEPAARIGEVLGRMEALEAEIPAVYARWDALDSRA